MRNDWPPMVLQQIETLEDSVRDYCHAPGEPCAGCSTQERIEANTRRWNLRRALLDAIYGEN